MTEILFIKTSSMGDVLHHMPAVTDARKHFPDARISWVVEEAFAPLARLHPGVNEVIPVATRRWRKKFYTAVAWRELFATIGRLRERAYDKIIDTQGLGRTGVIAKLARGERHGYGRASVRESFAARFYDVHHNVSRELHAIDRNRILTGLALGYAPSCPIDYGLDRSRFASPANRAVLLHATAQAKKLWPEKNWIEIGRLLSQRGLEIVLPWGTEAERARSERLQAALPGAEVPARQPLDEVASMLAGARIVAGVDTGLLHVAAALGVPLVAIFAGSRPVLTGPRGAGPMEILGAKGEPPSAAEVAAAIGRLL